MMTMDRETAKAIAEAMETAAAQVLAERFPGATVRLGRVSYDGSGSATVKLEIALADESGTAQTPERRALMEYGALYGCDDLVDRTFKACGWEYKVVGLRVKARVRPLLCERNDGKLFAFDVNTVRRALGQRF